jgi:hypothetical protein
MNATTTATGNVKLRPEDLFSLEQYSKQRPEFRPRVIAHKRARTVKCGPNATWLFEDRLTVQYQVQEMLRIDFESEACGRARGLQPAHSGRLELESDAADPVPDPTASRACGLKGVEDRCWVQAVERMPLRMRTRARKRGKDLLGISCGSSCAGDGGGGEGRGHRCRARRRHGNDRTRSIRCRARTVSPARHLA